MKTKSQNARRRFKSIRMKKSNRRGSASLDYVLVLGVILPLVLFLFTVVPRMIRLVYEMTVVLVGSPLM